MLGKKFKRTTWIMVGLFGFLLGLIAAKFLPSIHESWIILAILLSVAARRGYRLAAVVTILLAGLFLGWGRGQEKLADIAGYNNLYGQRVVFIANATQDAVYADRGQLEFDADKIEIIEPRRQSLAGKISVRGFGEASIVRGDIIQAEGKLFPTIGAKQGRISFAELKVLGRDGSVIEKFRHDFSAGMQSALPEPMASFALGLLIGQRNTLPENTKKFIASVGLTHIIAVSGYNLTILTRGVRRAFSKRSKYQTLVFSLILNLIFLLITGLSPSIVRAAIVSLLSILAWYFGRKIKPLMLILLAAALTAGWNPIYIWSDIGWYLSFLAFFGVLVVAPLLLKKFVRTKEPKPAAYLFTESLCAWLLTAPLIIFIFKDFSMVALLANLIIVPLVPLAMFLSAAAGLAGTYFVTVSGLAALPARVLLTFMLDSASLISQIPNALTQYSLSVWQLAVIYGCVVLFSLILWDRTKQLRVKITE